MNDLALLPSTVMEFGRPFCYPIVHRGGKCTQLNNFINFYSKITSKSCVHNKLGASHGHSDPCL